MAEYKRQGGFRGKTSRGGFNRFNRRDDGRHDFGGRPNFRRHSRDGHGEIFSATCASCHKPCEVPFRPMSGKPVYCNNCFRRHNQSSGDYGQRGNRERPEHFSRDLTFSSSSKSQTDERQIDILKKQLDLIDSKLEKIMRVIGVDQPIVSKAVKLTEKEVDKTPLKTIVLNATGTDKKTRKNQLQKKK